MAGAQLRLLQHDLDGFVKIRAARVTAAAPWPATTTIRAGSSPRPALSAWCNSGTPASGMQHLRQVRVHARSLPAARTTSDTGDETVMEPLSFDRPPF